MDSINIGDSISWTSKIGRYQVGTVKNIVVALNAAGDLVPWIDIEYLITKDVTGSVRLCATQSNLTMMRVCAI